MARQIHIPLQSIPVIQLRGNRFRQILSHRMAHRTTFSCQIKFSVARITVLTRTVLPQTTLTIHINSPAVRQTLLATRFIATAAK